MKLRPLVRILGRIVGIPRGNYLDPSSLGSGTPSSSNVLNGDSQWVTPGSMGYVPYTGATQDVDLGEYGIDTGYVTFDDTPTGTPTSQGTMSWDVDRQSVKLVMNGTTGHVMQDTFYYVKNQSGSTIPKGTVVMANGTLGASGRILVVPFLADGTYPSKFCMGVTFENIPNGGDGMVMDFGQIKGINTSMYSDGDILYASSTVAGGFTDVRPNSPNNIVTVAIVIHAASNGVIQVRPTFSSNINDDEGVVISTPSDGDVLTYELSSGLWKNSASVNLGSSDLTSSANTRTFTLNGTTSSNKLEISNGTNAVLHIAGNNTVWCRGAGNVSTNTAFGERALDANTTGTENTAFGYRALTSITTNINSSAFGASALFSNTGSQNNAFGSGALFSNTSGVRNNSFGTTSLLSLSSGSDNSAFGEKAGRFIADGSTANATCNQSLFLGSSTKSLANNQTNQIVIGYNAIGNGSNTATIGNTSIVATYLGGQVKVGSFASAPTGIEGAIYYDSVTKKHYGFDGTNWNAFY